MKLIGSSPLLFLILSLAATLILNFSSPLFLFSIFNTIIMALIVGNYRPSSSAEEVDGGTGWPSSYEDGKGAYDNINKVENDYYSDKDYEDDDDDDDDDRKGRYSSDGYDEDDDDSGSDGEIGWEEDDENEKNDEVVDDSLRKRIEEFIAKVNEGWREEWLRDNLDDQ